LKKLFKCPVCKRRIQHENPDFPFCSERCRLIDLGKWAGDDYTIADEEPVPWESGDSDA